MTRFFAVIVSAGVWLTASAGYAACGDALEPLRVLSQTEFPSFQSDGVFEGASALPWFRILVGQKTGAFKAIAIGADNELFRVAVERPTHETTNPIGKLTTYIGSIEKPSGVCKIDGLCQLNYKIAFQRTKRGKSMDVEFSVVSGGHREGGALLMVFDEYNLIPEPNEIRPGN